MNETLCFVTWILCIDSHSCLFTPRLLLQLHRSVALSCVLTHPATLDHFRQDEPAAPFARTLFVTLRRHCRDGQHCQSQISITVGARSKPLGSLLLSLLLLVVSVPSVAVMGCFASATHPTASNAEATANRRGGGRCTKWARELHRKAWSAWRSVQISHRGQYSIERLMAMDVYCRSTSILRIVFVCIATPLPALVISLLIELIPLQSPSAGSFANWGFWLRFWTTLGIMNLTMMWQLRVLIPELQFTLSKCVLASVIATSTYIGSAALVGELTVFPVPFLVALGGGTAVTISCTTILIVLGIRPSAMDSEVKTQLKHFFRLSFNCGVLLTVYPAYSALFLSAAPWSQSALILGLQVFKLTMKNMMARALVHLEDFMPEYVVLLVDVFNMLYLTSCMQNASSIHTMVLIIGLDCSQSLWEIRSIMKRVTTMKFLVEQIAQRSSRAGNSDFLELALYVCRTAGSTHRDGAKSIHLRACLPHKISREDAKLLETLETQNIFARGGREPRRRSLPAGGMIHSQSLVQTFARVMPQPDAPLASVRPVTATTTTTPVVSIQPREATPLRVTLPRRLNKLDSQGGALNVAACIGTFRALSSSERNDITLLHETLQSLFHVEYVMLVEFVECIIPFIYIIYSFVRSTMPSEKYYPHSHHSDDNNDDDTAGEDSLWSLFANVMLYTGLEFASFVMLNVMYWRKLRFLPLYQLGFVLENQIDLVQSKLVMWVILLLQFQLYHFGACVFVYLLWLRVASSWL